VIVQANRDDLGRIEDGREPADGLGFEYNPFELAAAEKFERFIRGVHPFLAQADKFECILCQVSRFAAVGRQEHGAREVEVDDRVRARGTPMHMVSRNKSDQFQRISPFAVCGLIVLHLHRLANSKINCRIPPLTAARSGAYTARVFTNAYCFVSS